MIITKGTARSIASHSDVLKMVNDRARLRDRVDIEMGGALDSFKLDMLTDWVQQEIRWRLAQKVVKL